MPRLEFKNSSSLGTAMAAAPAQFLYALSASHVNNNLPLIAESLQISLTTASWIVNVELIIVVITAVITGKLCDRFGTPWMMLIGCFIFALFNFFFIFNVIETSFYGVLFLRLLGSFGLGLMLPASTPLAVQLVKQNGLNVTIAIMSIMVPCGFILSSLIAGYVAEYSSWRYMFVATSGLSFVYFLLQIFILPFKNAPKRQSKIDFLGVLILSSGLTLFIVSLTGLSQSLIPYWVCIITLILSVGILAFFAFYNYKLSKSKLFPIAIFNKSTMLIESLLLLINVLGYLERFLMPFILMTLFKLEPGITGIIISITGCSTFVFAPLASYAFKKVIVRRLQVGLHFIYSFLLICNIINMQVFQNVILYTILTFISIGLTTSSTIILTNYNFLQIPSHFQNTIGVLNQLLTNAGHSIGVALAVMVNNFSIPKNEIITFTSITIILGCALLFSTINTTVAAFMGIFMFERGKFGYCEKFAHKVKTFNENLLGDEEMQQVDEFGSGQEDYGGQKILLFTGMNF